MSLEASTLLQNNAYLGSGGGICNVGGAVTISNGSLLRSNTSEFGGGGIWNDATVTISGSTLRNNSDA